jgi:hypothetical protein
MSQLAIAADSLAHRGGDNKFRTARARNQNEFVPIEMSPSKKQANRVQEQQFARMANVFTPRFAGKRQ